MSATLPEGGLGAALVPGMTAGLAVGAGGSRGAASALASHEAGRGGVSASGASASGGTARAARPQRRRGMTRKRRRLWIVLACGVGLGSATALALAAFGGSLVFFMAPTELLAKHPPPGQVVRLGGMVEKDSLTHTVVDGQPAAAFRVTDGNRDVRVTYVGILPDLFREGQGVVTLGSLQQDGSFRAQDVLAKHDETYMPRDVADALRKSGHWDPRAGAPPPAGEWAKLAKGG